MRTWWSRLRASKGRRVMHGHERVHLGELLRGFEGKWVAVKDGEVVMAADTPYALVGKLRERRIEDAAVIRAPGVDEPEMVGFG